MKWKLEISDLAFRKGTTRVPPMYGFSYRPHDAAGDVFMPIPLNLFYRWLRSLHVWVRYSIWGRDTLAKAEAQGYQQGYAVCAAVKNLQIRSLQTKLHEAEAQIQYWTQVDLRRLSIIAQLREEIERLTPKEAL